MLKEMLVVGSDSIMVISMVRQKTSEIVSIPRDTQAEIVGHGSTENQPCACLWRARYG